MKILVVTQHYWPSVGGAEIMLRRLAHAWVGQGHSVVTLTCHWDASTPAEEQDESVRVIRLPIWRARVVGTARFLWQLRRFLMTHRREFDVAYVSMLKHAAFACVGAGKSWRFPVVLRAEGAGETGDVAWQNSARLGGVIRRRCQQAEAIVAPSKAIEAELLKAGYDATQVRLFPNGVPIPRDSWTRERASDFRRRLSIPQLPTLCYTGRLHEEKGLGDLLTALPTIASTVGPVQLLLVGDGPDRSRLEALAEQLGVADHVHFIGAVADVDPYLLASDLYVLPSYHEGLSVALLEALALGLPAIASDIAPNRDLVPEQILPRFPVHRPNAIAELVARRFESHSAAADASAVGRHIIVSRYGLPELARRHLQLFHELIVHRPATSLKRV